MNRQTSRQTQERGNLRAQSYHQKPLPSKQIPFTSDEGRELFAEMLGEGGLRSYWALAEQYMTQSDPSMCGLSSLTMCLNALKVDPKRVWKGVWRWWDEEMLKCAPERQKAHCQCTPFDLAKEKGVTLEELLSYGKCNDLHLTGFFASDKDCSIDNHLDMDTKGLDHFREILRRTQLDSPVVGGDAKGKQELLVVAFSRLALGQTGDGHFSPIGGYSPSKDMVLVMDVARFKYPSYFVSVPELWRAMTHVDVETLKPRGYVLVSDRRIGDRSVEHDDSDAEIAAMSAVS